MHYFQKGVANFVIVHITCQLKLRVHNLLKPVVYNSETYYFFIKQKLLSVLLHSSDVIYTVVYHQGTALKVNTITKTLGSYFHRYCNTSSRQCQPSISTKDQLPKLGSYPNLCACDRNQRPFTTSTKMWLPKWAIYFNVLAIRRSNDNCLIGCILWN